MPAKSVAGGSDGGGRFRRKNGRAVVVGRDNYEIQGSPPSASVFGYIPSPQRQDLPAVPASTGPLAVADIYGDGKLDLLVGGGVNV